MKLKIEIKMDNAAFEPDADCEACRILKDLADDMFGKTLSPGKVFRLRDINDNNVGSAKVTR